MIFEEILDLACDWDLSYEVSNKQEELLDFIEAVLSEGGLDHTDIVTIAKSYGFNPDKNDDIIYFIKDLISKYVVVFENIETTTLH